MITYVLEGQDAQHNEVQWLNARHDPDRGVLVVHVPPGCGPQLLAEEVLSALGRSTAMGTTGLRTHGQTWATAWLATSEPRTDLALYGAHRLTAETLGWLRELALLPRLNVWLIISSIPKETNGVAVWPWSLFLELQWHQRQPISDGLGENVIDLPPFPLSHPAAHKLGDRSWLKLDHMTASYSGARLYETRHLLARTRPPQRRNVAAALARICLLARTKSELNILARLLEHDVFLHGAVLTIDIDAVLQIIRDNDHHDLERLPEPDSSAHSDPVLAARTILTTTHEFMKPQEFRACDVAADGSHVIELNGTRRDIPAWLRWPLRAAVWHQTPTERQRPRNPGTVVLYSEIRPVRTQQGVALRNSLEPLAYALEPEIRLSSYLNLEPRVDQSEGFGAFHAITIWSLRQSPPDNDVYPRPDDPDVGWLLDHGCAVISDNGTPQLAPWLYDATRDERKAPGFDRRYRRDPSTDDQPEASIYRRLDSETARSQ